MDAMTRKLAEFFERFPRAALVEITEVKGSTPRESGAWMLVSPVATLGTIGGGQLEFLAIDKARELIARNVAHGTMTIPLGPEIGQCCGGRVALDIRIVGDREREALADRIKTEVEKRPRVYLFGAGHVGKALAAALSALPFRVILVDTREDMLAGIAPGVETILTAMPEAIVRDAPPASAFAILTHDHALDFLIAAEALRRKDAAYVGMIGSETKKATFRGWFTRQGGSEAEFAQLVSPIGGEDIRDKRPEVIAALTAAEITRALLSGRE